MHAFVDPAERVKGALTGTVAGVKLGPVIAKGTGDLVEQGLGRRPPVDGVVQVIAPDADGGPRRACGQDVEDAGMAAAGDEHLPLFVNQQVLFVLKVVAAALRKQHAVGGRRAARQVPHGEEGQLSVDGEISF